MRAQDLRHNFELPLGLMRAYAAQYNRPMVLQTYRVCERVLQEQLGIPPMESTRKLYEAALGTLARPRKRPVAVAFATFNEEIDHQR